MEIKGTIHEIGELLIGTSARGQWKKLTLVVDVPGQYAKKVAVELWGDKAESASRNLTTGMPITVHIDIESREYNGRWFTTAKAWKFETGNNQQDDRYVPPAQPTPPTYTPPVTTSPAAATGIGPNGAFEPSAPGEDSEIDDLPF